jgi:hypothetical protein
LILSILSCFLQILCDMSYHSQENTSSRPGKRRISFFHEDAKREEGPHIDLAYRLDSPRFQQMFVGLKEVLRYFRIATPPHQLSILGRILLIFRLAETRCEHSKYHNALVVVQLLLNDYDAYRCETVKSIVLFTIISYLLERELVDALWSDSRFRKSSAVSIRVACEKFTAARPSKKGMSVFCQKGETLICLARKIYKF